MSTYHRFTKHPVTKRWENARWIDDYFGRHHYGCQFPSEEAAIWDTWIIQLVTDINAEEADILNAAISA